tara:strand:+ start:60 stop:263 length:204 start_codon:yes stop_codon:yes gene_type:complete
MARLTVVTTEKKHTPENIAHMLVRCFKDSMSEEQATTKMQEEGITALEWDAFLTWRIDNPAKLEDFY